MLSGQIYNGGECLNGKGIIRSTCTGKVWMHQARGVAELGITLIGFSFLEPLFVANFT